MKCPHPITVKDKKTSKFTAAPCGQCGACLQNRRAEWSFRIKEELRGAENGYFITLTYDDEKIKWDPTGSIPSLRKKDLQDFIKRLRKEARKYSKRSIRYYAVGEYGKKTQRPHYHLCGFNIPREGRKKIREIWGNGNVDISTLEGGSIHYVSKFHMNPNMDEIIDPESGEIIEREAEFATMSRNPGIGAGYVKRAKKWHQENEHLYVVNGGFKQRMPRYYKKKIFSPITLKRIGVEAEEQKIKRYWEEIKRLKKLKIEDPELSLIIREEEAAKSAKKIKKSKDTF